MYVTGAADANLAFPSDGMGGISVLRANSTALGVTTFATLANGNGTVSDAGGWTLASTAVGDYVTVSTGEWGIVVAKAAPLLTVDRWRVAITGQYGEHLRTPATGAANGVKVYGPCIMAGASEILISNINFPLSTAAQTFALTNAFGTVIAGLTWTIPAAPTNAGPYFGDSQWGGGLPFNQPFGIKCSSTGIIPAVSFTIVK